MYRASRRQIGLIAVIDNTDGPCDESHAASMTTVVRTLRRDGHRPVGADDPVRRRRATAERLARLASRTGYLLIAAAVVIFFVALATGFDATLATVITAALIAGCVLLAPAIIVGYAVKAAERDDRERGL